MNETATDSGQEFRFPSKDDTEIFARRMVPDGEPRGHLLWVHGFAEHSGRYLETFRWFARHGFESWMLDLRGHGRSGGEVVSIDRFSDYTDDLEVFYAHVLGRGEMRAPIFCLGHSMGGLVLGRLLQEREDGGDETNDLEGAIFLSPFMGLEMPLPAWKEKASQVLSRFLPNLLLSSEFSTDVLSKDPEVGRAYEADPLIARGARSRWFTETVTAQSVALTKAGQIELPVLVMHGLDDDLAAVEATQKFYQAIGSDDREIKLWDDLRHELLNEIEKEQVRTHILGWIENRLGGPPL
ncbi:MAG: lysophospholipase [Verrucomicrobiales bacterium]